MSINSREKAEILDLARQYNYRTHKHQSYSNSDLSTIILGEHDLTKESRNFQNAVMAILRPQLVIHYLHGLPGKKSAHAELVRSLWSKWHARYGTEVTGLGTDPSEEEKAPPWCDHKEARAQLLEETTSEGVLIAQSIERQYCDGRDVIIAIVSAHDVLRGSLACRILRDENEFGIMGDGITHVVIELHDRASR